MCVFCCVAMLLCRSTVSSDTVIQILLQRVLKLGFRVNTVAVWVSNIRNRNKRWKGKARIRALGNKAVGKNI